MRYIAPPKAEIYKDTRDENIISIFINKAIALLRIAYTLNIEAFRHKAEDIIEILRSDSAGSRYAEDLIGILELMTLHHAKMYGKIGSGVTEPAEVLAIKDSLDKAQAEIRVKNHIKQALEEVTSFLPSS